MHIPLATYRLQFNPSFGFSHAGALLPYLSELGVSDIYASPILRAKQGSTHGYDVTNPDELNPELGTEEEFQTLAAEVKGRRMGWLQDIVPNHMAYSSENWMLMDTFEHGARSRFEAFFDVFRDHPDPDLRTRVMTPFLEGPLDQLLQRREIQLILDPAGLAIRYYDWRLPLRLPSYETVLWHSRERVAQPPPAGKPERSPPGAGVLQAGDDPGLHAFIALRGTFARLAVMDDSPEKHRRLAQAKETLFRLHEEHPMVRVYIDGVLEAFNHPPEGPTEHSLLYKLLDQQLFQLVPWQTAYEKINYRRFFYLSEFIAVCVENPQVFQRMHGRIVELARAGVFTGVRIDHIDGLYNPRAYLAMLRRTLPEAYIVVEKILELHEFLPTEWPIQGTSGYKYCNYLNGVFCDRENEQAMTDIYESFIGVRPDYEQLLYNEKKKILKERMAGEVAYLAHLAMQVAPSDVETQNVASLPTPESMQRALTALMAAWPVYRTYIDADHFSEQDRTLLTDAVHRARDKCLECRPEVDLLVKLLLPESWLVARASGLGSRVTGHESWVTSREAQQYFLMRFQQFTGPAMAKGFEDTLLYVYNRFVSLNEVGGDPDTFGVSLDRFHEFQVRRARDWPHGMNATSTHDSKRGEDVRARLNVLSEIPDRWRQAVTRWAQMNERHKRRYGDAPAPRRNDEYLLYQTLVGALPFDVETQDVASLSQRIKDYMTKAVREAKIYSSWVQPNEQYEGACMQFVERILDRSGENPFWPDFLAFQRDISEYGIYNSLAQTALKMTCPGVPDFYQGAELWDLSLVDPDNRRPVDFDKRMRRLGEIRQTAPHARLQLAHKLMESRQDGRIKLFLIHTILRARAENRSLFENGDYTRAAATGSRTRHVIAFWRQWQDSHALTVVPRFPASLIRPGDSPTGRAVWEDTRIPLPPNTPSDWHNPLTDERVTAHGELFLGDLLCEFPVAVLIGRGRK